MIRRLTFFLFTAAASTAVWSMAACVGDDPTATPSSADTGSESSTPDDANVPDIGSPSDSGTGTGCDRKKEFGAPVPVSSLNTAENSETGPWLSPDGLTVHFTRKEPDAGHHLWTASRATRDAAFNGARRLEELVTSGSEKAASLTSDGRFIYFASNALDAGADFDIYAATRENAGALFGAPVRLGISSQYIDETPNVLPDNTGLYSAVRGEVDGGPFDGVYRLYRSDLPNGPRRLLDTPPHIPGYELISPVVTADETMLIFAAIPSGSAPKIPGYKDKWDIFTSRRDKKSDAWGAAVIEATLNSALNEFPHWISPDGCELWLDQETATGHDIFVARRAP